MEARICFEFEHELAEINILSRAEARDKIYQYPANPC
jgi:hypothetical protein